MTAPLHVVFGESGAGSLKMALRTLGLAQRVIALSDDLGYGPIDPADPVARVQWSEDTLLLPNDEASAQHHTAFWDEASQHPRAIAWLSRRSAQELAGFSELLSRRTRRTHYVDVADFEIRRHTGIPPKWGAVDAALSRSFQIVGDAAIVKDKLPLRHRLVPPSLVEAYRSRWALLRHEGSVLRVVGPSGLSSVPITYYDHHLLGFVTQDWQPSSRVVANTLGVMNADYDQVGDQLLWGRLLVLFEAGALQARFGRHYAMHDVAVRLP